MAANRFDFELVAKDEASATIKGLEQAVAKMLPDLDKAGNKLQLGGRKNVEGLDDLNGRLAKMGSFAKSGVQYFGDMVPPLKLTGELAGKYGGALASFGAGGAAVYGVGRAFSWVSGQIREASKEAYNLSVQSMDAGMSVHDLTQVAGGMEILGADTDKARNSVESLSRALTDAMNNRQSTITGVLNQIGVPIVQKADHTADTMKTLENLAEVFPTIGAQKQKTVSDALGLTPEMLALLRDGAHYKDLMAKSDKYGLTMTGQQIAGLKEVNAQYSELDARLDGMWRKMNIAGAVAGYVTPFDHSDAGIKSVKESQKYDKDDGAHFYHGSQEQDIIHRARRDADFKKSLSFSEGLELAGGKPGKALQAKLDTTYLASWRAQALQADMSGVPPVHNAGVPPENKAMFDQPQNNAFGLRHHNPLNLRAASNETGKAYSPKAGSFSTFATDKDGLAAASRQLFLYGDRGKHTLNDVINTFAPSSENKVDAYIGDVARDTGFKPGENIDLHSPGVLEKLLPAMIKHEQGAQPFSLGDIDSGINDAISDPRWGGKRDPEYLQEQRNQTADHALQPGIIPPDAPADHSQQPGIITPDTPANNSQQSSIITPDQTTELTKVLREITAQAGKEGKTQIEVLLTGPNGDQKRVPVPFGGKVSASMSSY